MHCNFSVPWIPFEFVTHKLRLEIQMHIYRQNELFRYFENKLHAIDYLRHAHIPHLDVRYGAFHERVPHSSFGVFNDTALELSMQKLPFVFKPATDGMGGGVVDAHVPADRERVRNIVRRPSASRWGQKEPHHGFLIVERMQANRTKEIMCYVQFGSIGSCFHKALLAPAWKRHALSAAHRRVLGAYASQVARDWAASWFRLDVFATGDQMRVNELTFPGHIPVGKRESARAFARAKISTCHANWRTWWSESKAVLPHYVNTSDAE